MAGTLLGTVDLPVVDTQVDESISNTEVDQVDEGDQKTTETSKIEETKVDAVEGAPEAYDLKAQEGNIYDSEVLEAYTEVARELNMSNESAQKLLDKVAPVMVARQQEQIAAIQTDWRNQTTADKEVGGGKLDENLGVAKKALDALGTPALSQLLTETGLGNHPEVVRLLYRAGKQISQDGFIGGKPSPQDETPAAKMYPNHK